MNGTQKRWCAIAATAALIYGAGSLFQPTVVVGQSMSPTLKSGRVIWVDRTHYRTHAPERGEVVVFKREGLTYVKRVYRTAGEVVHYLAAGRDWVGPIRENRVADMQARYRDSRSVMRVRALTVPEGHLFVVGDNAAVSEDSRSFGPIPMESVIGRAHLDADQTKILVHELVPRRMTPRPGGGDHAERPSSVTSASFRVRHAEHEKRPRHAEGAALRS
jgi:signal peptidase I